MFAVISLFSLHVFLLLKLVLNSTSVFPIGTTISTIRFSGRNESKCFAR